MGVPIVDIRTFTLPSGVTALASGQQATIKVAAHDVVATTEHLVVNVGSLDGVTSVDIPFDLPISVNVPIVDPAKYQVSAPAQGTIAPVAGQPGVFTYTKT